MLNNAIIATTKCLSKPPIKDSLAELVGTIKPASTEASCRSICVLRNPWPYLFSFKNKDITHRETSLCFNFWMPFPQDLIKQRPVRLSLTVATELAKRLES